MTGYNKLIRPVLNNNDSLTVRFKLKLSQLLDVHEKNQIMTTNVWLKQEWEDYKLRWLPESYGGVHHLHIPADLIWLPDIVLYNNADGKYQVTIMTKALVYWNGTVLWEPPAIYQSMCQIHVEWFPFDEQYCEMKFGSWTYDGNEVDLVHFDSNKVLPTKEGTSVVWVVDEGIDVTEYYPSAEWDLMAIPGKRHQERFVCCSKTNYVDITYLINLRRKTLFYTVNLIIPCVGISFLTVLVFYLPSDSGEKVALSISILISLTLFFLLLVEIIPSTSLVVPLIAKYLLFTMVMVTLSIAVTVITLNVHFRSPNTHNMPAWVKRIVLSVLPRMLCMERPIRVPSSSPTYSFVDASAVEPYGFMNAAPSAPVAVTPFVTPTSSYYENVPGSQRQQQSSMSAAGRERVKAFMHAATESACYIARHLKQKDAVDEVKEDWRYAAHVMDRLFLLVFSTIVFAGTCGIILNAPVIYDTRIPIKS